MSGDLVQFLASLPLPVMLLVALSVPQLMAFVIGQIILGAFTPQELSANSTVGIAK